MTSSDFCHHTIILRDTVSYGTALALTLLSPLWKTFTSTRNQMTDTSRNPLQSCLVFQSIPSSETQGQSVGPGENARRKFTSMGGRAPGYRLSPDHFQTVKRMLAPDWAQKMLCIIVPNWRTASPDFFSWVRTRRLLSRHIWPGSFTKLS